MYEELVKLLRHDSESRALMVDAADAIEELTEDNTALNGTVNNLIQQIGDLGKPKWIPVTERLPEKHQWCLVVGENLYDMDFINSRGVWTIHDKPYAPIDYWMPLPEPPKEEAPAEEGE